MLHTTHHNARCKAWRWSRKPTWTLPMPPSLGICKTSPIMFHFQNCQVNFRETCVIGLTYHPMIRQSRLGFHERGLHWHTLCGTWKPSGRFSIRLERGWWNEAWSFEEKRLKWTLRNLDVRALHTGGLTSELISPRWVRVDPIIITCTSPTTLDYRPQTCASNIQEKNKASKKRLTVWRNNEHTSTR